VAQRWAFRVRAWKYAHRIDPCGVRFLRRALRPGDLALDIGAHKGGYLYWMRRAVGRAGRVLAFEPQPALSAYLRGVCAAASYANVEVLPYAVSDHAGAATLFHPGARSSTGATLVAGLFPENDAADEVRAVTLDELLAARPELAAPRYMKIDVETHELEVLRGARRTLETQRPVVQLEADRHIYGDRPITAVFDFLLALGLAGYFFFERRLLPLAAFDPGRHQAESRRHYPQNPAYASNFLFLDAERDRALLGGWKG
jgi:FkbM family methyltransferase